MNFLTLAAALCVAVSSLLPLCASDQVNVKQSLKQYGDPAVHQAQLTLPLLPRKLKLREVAVVKSFDETDIMLQRKLMEAPSGNKHPEKEENEIHHHPTRKGTWREWVESPNKSEYFTMDYAGVRRRRHIHNKQNPFFVP